MRLEELVGKKVVRTKPAVFNFEEDDSYTGSDYITIVEASGEFVRYIQHSGPEIGERKFNFQYPLDRSFMDDNWMEYVGD